MYDQKTLPRSNVDANRVSMRTEFGKSMTSSGRRSFEGHVLQIQKSAPNVPWRGSRSWSEMR